MCTPVFLGGEVGRVLQDDPRRLLPVHLGVRLAPGQDGVPGVLTDTLEIFVWFTGPLLSDRN